MTTGNRRSRCGECKINRYGSKAAEDLELAAETGEGESLLEDPNKEPVSDLPLIYSSTLTTRNDIWKPEDTGSLRFVNGHFMR